MCQLYILRVSTNNCEKDKHTRVHMASGKYKNSSGLFTNFKMSKNIKTNLGCLGKPYYKGMLTWSATENSRGVISEVNLMNSIYR